MRGPSSRRADDLNGDGRVDIRDALAFARQLEQGEPAAPQWDFNADGVVDRRDVEAVAARAVALDRGLR